VKGKRDAEIGNGSESELLLIFREFVNETGKS
jgi:hypothetical protein